MTKIYQFTCRTDNFGVLVHDPESGTTIAIDAPEEAPIRNALAAMGWQLTDILVTHHHGDHTGAISALKQSFAVQVIAPASEAENIPDVDQRLCDGDQITLGPFAIQAIETPGHTLGHLCYWFHDQRLLFAGDTLFCLGCGRVFEGTKAQMFSSLKRLEALPDDTLVYCGHDYTKTNAAFAQYVDPANRALQDRVSDVSQLIARREASLPTTLGQERATNPFLRPHDPAIRQQLGLEKASDLDVFSALRDLKDRF